MFHQFLNETGIKKKETYVKSKKSSLQQSKFENLILSLRILKFARVLYSRIESFYQKDIMRVYVERLKDIPRKKNARCVAKYAFHVASTLDQEKVLTIIDANVHLSSI